MFPGKMLIPEQPEVKEMLHVYAAKISFHSYMHTPFLVECQLILNIILALGEICERPTLRCLLDCIVTC